MMKVRQLDEQYAHAVGTGAEPDSFDLFERE
jgi:hypothetical protein